MLKRGRGDGAVGLVGGSDLGTDMTQCKESRKISLYMPQLSLKDHKLWVDTYVMEDAKY